MYARGDDFWDKLQTLGDPYQNDKDIIIADDDQQNVLTASVILVDEMVKQLRIYLGINQIFITIRIYAVSNGDAYSERKAGLILDEVMHDLLKPR